MSGTCSKCASAPAAGEVNGRRYCAYCIQFIKPKETK
jgi:hypothetical protein